MSIRFIPPFMRGLIRYVVPLFVALVSYEIAINKGASSGLGLVIGILAFLIIFFCSGPYLGGGE